MLNQVNKFMQREFDVEKRHARAYTQNLREMRCTRFPLNQYFSSLYCSPFFSF